MHIKKLYEIKNPVISFEVFPPRQDSPSDVLTDSLSKISSLSPGYISVTYGSGEIDNNSKSIELASHIKNSLNIEPMVHLTARGTYRSQMKSMLQEMKQKNIENIMALGGDIPQGNSNTTQGDFEHARDLIEFIKDNGNFSIGAGCYPEGHIECENTNANYEHLYEKQLAGADFFVSQLFFENGSFFRFKEESTSRGINKPIVAGLMPILGKTQIQRMIFQCGVSLPSSIIKILHKYEHSPEDLKKAGIEYTCMQIEDLVKNGHKNIHIYSMNKPEIAASCKDTFDSMF
ncbi:methylenetetrahydrofolate reductase [Proteocatella sphenisci]|uniref:methylenetetrahydrofolate reductase n=1 Tax=Proteocatella sphenisci TaxID=181070 RepID=UPI00048AE887|nr:methylenetetrahydrofolate reductase [Proteocatella sphenisci]